MGIEVCQAAILPAAALQHVAALALSGAAVGNWPSAAYQGVRRWRPQWDTYLPRGGAALKAVPNPSRHSRVCRYRCQVFHTDPSRRQAGTAVSDPSCTSSRAIPPGLRRPVGRAGTPLPDYVQREFEDYLRCGCPELGFLRMRCDTCHADHRVGFSCRRRGFCPSRANAAAVRYAQPTLGRSSVSRAYRRSSSRPLLTAASKVPAIFNVTGLNS